MEINNKKMLNYYLRLRISKALPQLKVYSTFMCFSGVIKIIPYSGIYLYHS